MADTTYLQSLFQNSELLEHALTHKSWVNEHPSIRTSNERLEYLGDAVLEFIVSRYIFELLPDKEEGYLTALRANLVNTVNLAEVAVSLSLGEAIHLSKGEEDGGGRTNPSILANTVEAVIGALYLDSGIDAVDSFIKENLLAKMSDKLNEPLKDAKSRLQEYVQAQGLMAPKYEVAEEDGPDHDKTFTLEVMVNGEVWGTGSGKNKSFAAQEAAHAALKKMGQE